MNRTQFYRTALMLTALAALAGCAHFEGNVPIESDVDQVRYISPKNRDGIQDRLEIDIDFPAISGLVVTGWSWSISDDGGREVYHEAQSAGKPSFFRRLLGAKSSLPLPERLVWDGADSNGIYAADGRYYLTVSAADDRGNSGSLGPIPVIVDDTPPSATLTLPYTVLSPNGDGNQDLLDVYIGAASNEALWTGRVIGTDGGEVALREWNGTPTVFQWDGASASDGEYRFVLSSVDQAGNSFSVTSPALLRDSSLPPISASLSSLLFSPNGDGIRDSVILTLTAEESERIDAARLTVIDSRGNALITLPAPARYPAEIVVTGLTSSGRAVPDGRYYVRFEADYRNGARPAVVTPAITVDTTPPYAVISADIRLFSPDGDGRRDTIALFQSTEEAEQWTGTLTNSSGVIVFARDWGRRAVSIDWDGRSTDGTTVPDGLYRYTLIGVDAAGNATRRALDGIRVDTRPTPVALNLTDRGFSPNGDGIAETARFTPVVEVPDGVIGWRFEVFDETKSAVYTLSGLSMQDLPRTIPWDGAGAVEGLYRGRIAVEYEKGNLTLTESPESVALDTSGPEVRIETAPLPFGPDGDGVNDRVAIRIAVQDPAGVAETAARILDPAGNLFITLPREAFSPAGWSWDGRSPRGELVQSASEYRIAVTATDQLGNENAFESVLPVDILVIRDGDRLKISISSIYFKPNTADYLNIDTELAQRNLATLDRLAEILKKYADYRILLEGHAVRVYWDRADRWPTEERDVLIPLSRDRAEAIRSALSSRGINPTRMSIDGIGGYRPVVPHGDLNNRWKNRRVEFVLVK